MATSLPWSVKGVDPRTRDAAKAAARRAGMTLGEWLDHKIRDESEPEPEPLAGPAPEQLDIAALSERLAQLSKGQMDTSAQAGRLRNEPPAPSRDEFAAVIDKASSLEKLTRDSSVKTAGALDSIARWIEKTESRLIDGERSAAVRQERATAVIADAIKTMGERLADVERHHADAAQQAATTRVAGPRLAFSRDGLAAAVNDIRSRQRVLDDDVPAPSQDRPGVSETRIAALRQDLRDLSARVGAAPAAAAPDAADNAGFERILNSLNTRLDRLDRPERLEPVTKPLARIEEEVARLSQERSGESYQRVELEIAHLAAKIDALAARGADRTLIAPVLRDLGDLREIVSRQDGDRQLQDMSQQVTALSREIGEMRATQPDSRELRSLSSAIDDVREAILSDRQSARHLDSGALTSLSRQVETLADKIDTLPAMRPDIIHAQAEQLAARLGELDASGLGSSGPLANRIEALVIKLEDLASGQPNKLEARIDALQQRIEVLAEQGPTGLSRQIDALAGRLESLAASSSLTQIVAEGKGVKVAKVDFAPVEEMLRHLADKIDEAGRPGADARAFDVLEQQISGIAQRLDAAAATRSAETGIERTLQDLVGHLQNLRQETSQAAERAASKVMADMGGRGTASGQNLTELSGLLSGMRDTQASSGRETQDAIGAVHQTLETVISRLASIEAELSTERARPAASSVRPQAARRPSEPAIAAMPVARPLDVTPGLSVAAEDRIAGERTPPAGEPLTSLDLPLEPGSGRPKAGAVTVSPQDAQSVRQNLIAAARRSAKAASDAAAATPAAAPDVAKGSSRLKEIMEKRRRPLLLGLAALVLAMGTAHVVTGALKGEAPKPAAAKLAPEAPIAPSEAPAAPATPAPEADKPKNQSSLQMPAKPATPQSATAPTPSFVAQALASEAQPQDGLAQPMAVASLPPQAEVKPATALGEIPNTLGTAGLRKAAEAGDARAVYELASRAADGPTASRDPKLALRLFERAAVAGLAPAQFRLGNMFEKGVGAPRDAALARVWYERAAERGNAKAMHNLAVLFAEGINGKPDYANANLWFQKAAELGVRDSQYNLAILLGRGLGAPTDLGQSYLWFAVAAGQGDDDAARKRDDVAQRLSSTDLAAVKAKADAWKPKPLEALANDVTTPAKGWDETAGPSAARKPAKPVRG